MDAATRASVNRAIRNIQSELEFLTDTELLTQSQLSQIQSLLPKPNSTPAANGLRQQTTSPANHISSLSSRAFSNLNLNEKQSHIPTPQPPSPAPPVYSPPATQTIAKAVSLYAYNPTDAGDLALVPNDRISITEFMNADWAKGRCERTGQEGIFPRTYVSITDDKVPSSNGMPPPPPRGGSNYGNMPVQVSQSGGGAGDAGPGRLEEGGKKVGKKLGNAAVFGAGATLGSKVVSSIF